MALSVCSSNASRTFGASAVISTASAPSPTAQTHADPKESRDLLGAEAKRAVAMKKELTAWLGSVVRSLNGEDYPSK